MPCAGGFVKFAERRLVGTFDVDGTPRYLCVKVESLNHSFECGHAILTYDDIAKLDGDCLWNGTLGKEDVQMDLVSGGVSIAGRLDTTRRSTHLILGVGTWDTVERTLSPQNNVSNVPVDLPSPHDAIKSTAKAARVKQLLESSIPIIVVFGQSGSGKSTFINLITSEKQKVGSDLQSCTSDISFIEVNIGGKSVVVVDTPGIDDTRNSIKEADILKSIADQLALTGANRLRVTGVLLLHRINENRFSQTATRISNMLKSIYGNYKMSNLLLCTTMWDQVKKEDGDVRLRELCENPAWKELISKGARLDTISSVDPDARTKAETILSQLIVNAQPMKLVIKDELINRIRNMEVANAAPSFGQLLKEVQTRRSLEELRVRRREESEARVAIEMEALRVQELEVERLRTQAEEQARALQTQAQRFLQERQQAKIEMKALREQMRKTGLPIAAKVQEVRRARESEVAVSKQRKEAPNPAEQFDPERPQHGDGTADSEINRLRELARKQRDEKRARQREARERKNRQSEQAQTQKNRVKQLQQELKKAESATKELRARIRREETSARHLEINETKRPATGLTAKVTQGFLRLVSW